MKKLKFGACLPTFGNASDRYCSSYKESKTIPEMFEIASRVNGLKGIELVGNWHINENNFNEIKGYLNTYGLEASMLVPDLWTQAKWGKGSFTSRDAKIRKDAVAEVKRVMDMAAEVKCDKVDLWLGQDGYDYPFQADYIESWFQMVDCIRECADHRKDVKICIEYKLKEPRTHIFVNSAAKTKLMINEVDRSNVGVLLDIGHATAAQENAAEAIALVANDGKKKLFYIHLNDNYGQWDDDMMFGSIHIIEGLELLYWLNKVGYDDYYTLDIFPYREDGRRAAEESIAWITGLNELLDKIGNERIAETIKTGDPIESSKMLREIFLSRNGG